MQYHQSLRDEHLPPASYSLVQQVEDKGVFSFCMCPGGIIAPAATNAKELVVNGWSPSKRNNPFANSGMVVTTEVPDAVSDNRFAKKMKENNWQENDPLLLMRFQQMVEEKAYEQGGGNYIAPSPAHDRFLPQYIVFFASRLQLCSRHTKRFIASCSAFFYTQPIAAGFSCFW